MDETTKKLKLEIAAQLSEEHDQLLDKLDARYGSLTGWQWLDVIDDGNAEADELSEDIIDELIDISLAEEIMLKRLSELQDEIYPGTLAWCRAVDNAWVGDTPLGKPH